MPFNAKQSLRFLVPFVFRNSLQLNSHTLLPLKKLQCCTVLRVIHQAWRIISHIILHVQIKIKCTLVQALRLCTGCTARRGSRGIALLFLDHDTIKRWKASVTPRPVFTPVKDPLPIEEETGWAPEPAWPRAENLAPIGIRSPNRPARSQSLYQLSYLASSYFNNEFFNYISKAQHM
jgi:hypothetical protein